MTTDIEHQPGRCDACAGVDRGASRKVMQTSQLRRVILICICVATFVPKAKAQLKQYDSRYYTIYTDIGPEEEKEAAIRMTRMAEEYHQRTKGFAGVIRTKFPFYLYRSSQDYYRAGGPKGSSGFFLNDGPDSKLMAIAGRHLGQDTWHVVQHEGFHQFAHAVIGGEMPIWLDEGLAEYFGEAIFTGDGFVTGIVPPWREQRLKDEINAGQLMPVTEMMAVSPQQWSDQMSIRNYDQAWSMVHFLVHGDDGKYTNAFAQCITKMSRGKPFDSAWQETLFPQALFQQRWTDWWTTRPPSPTRELYARAAVATMTSFIARAWQQRQTFSSFAAFHSAVDDDTLKINPDDWLPPSLIKNNMRLYGSLPNWEITTGPTKQPLVKLTVYDGTRVTGTFTLRGDKVDQVTVDVDDMAQVLSDARALLEAGKRQPARKLVVAAMRRIPNSAMIADARKFLQANQQM